MKLYIIRKLEASIFQKSKNYRSSSIASRVIDEKDNLIDTSFTGVRFPYIIDKIIKSSITRESIMSERNFELLKSDCFLISKDYHLDRLQVFLKILTLSIIGLDDTSAVTEISKNSI